MPTYDQSQQSSAQQTRSDSTIPSLGSESAQAQSAELHQYSGAPLQVAQAGVEGAGGPLPHLDTIQASFGHHDISNIRTHNDGGAKNAALAIGAQAYATGDDIAFATAPDLHTAAHEAAHVIQQRAGVHLKGGAGQTSDQHERHADAVADRVIASESAEDLLDTYTGNGGPASVQRRDLDAGVSPAPSDAGVSSAEQPDCVEALGGSTQYRSAGIASASEIETYRTECEARARAEYGRQAALKGSIAVKIIGGAVYVVVEIGASVTDTLAMAGQGVVRVGKTAWAGITFDEEELLALGSENLEIIEFITNLVVSGKSFYDWVTEPAGPVAQMLLDWSQSRLEELLNDRDVEEILQAVSLKAGEIAADAAKWILIKMLIASPILKTTLGAVSWAIARAALGAGLAPLTQMPTNKTSGSLLGILAIELVACGLLETISGPRRRLESQYPQIFSIADQHKCAFLWAWIEPELPTIEAMLLDQVDALEAR